MTFTRTQRYLLSVLAGILMVISFPFTGSVTLLAFLAWIPLLLVEDEISTKKIRSSNVFIQAFIVFTIYNLGTTWWVSYASLQGALLAYVLNTLFMTILFYLFHISKKYLGKTLGYSSLLFYWVSFEFLHYHWELSWPWLHLGNYFS
ncbi:MAG: apolipoprotein N-acyltransferase, partial [Bacteroidia bacterium]